MPRIVHLVLISPDSADVDGTHSASGIHQPGFSGDQAQTSDYQGCKHGTIPQVAESMFSTQRVDVAVQIEAIPEPHIAQTDVVHDTSVFTASELPQFDQTPISDSANRFQSLFDHDRHTHNVEVSVVHNFVQSQMPDNVEASISILSNQQLEEVTTENKSIQHDGDVLLNSNINEHVGHISSIPSSAISNEEQDSDAIKSADVGIHVAMSYASDIPDQLVCIENTPTSTNRGKESSDDVSNTGPSTIDKKKRKKRYVKKPCDSEELFNVNVDLPTYNFYQKYLANKFIKTKKTSENTIVIDINGHTVTYVKFYESFKARRDISNEVTVAFVEFFNEQVYTNVEDKNSRMKISFSPYFASKLNISPEKFKVQSVSRELRNMNKKFNLTKCDLLYIPLVHDHHWMLICVNSLFKKINFIDFLQDVDRENKSIIVSNMITNFHKACSDTKCFNFDLVNFEKETQDDLPQQTTTFDCGVFLMLYMEDWNGQEFKMFPPEIVSEFRKLVAHEMASSTLNDMTSEVQDFKKRKLA